MAQAVLVAAAFALTGLVPDRGQPGLYISLVRSGAAPAVAFAAAHGAAVLRRGPTANSLVLLAPSNSLVFDALAEGALYLAVPARWCGAAQTPTDFLANKSANHD